MAEKSKARPQVRVKKILFALGCAVIGVLFVMNILHYDPIDESFLQDYDEFNAYERVNEEPPVYEVSEDDETVGYLALTGHYGYQSEVVMATLVDMQGTILDVRAYSQDESPSYFRKLIGQSFFKKNFIGDPIAEGFSIDTNVNAVSHATISSNAATKAVEEGVTYIGEHYLDTPVTQHGNEISIGYLDALVLIMLILAFAATRWSKNKKLVWVCRVYSIVVMGFLAAQFITLSVLIALFSLDWPSVADYLRWYLLVFGAFLLIIVTGKNSYCAYICPFGALEEAVFAMGGPIGKKPLNPAVGKLLRWMPGILIFISLALALGLHNLEFANYEPFSLIFGQVGVGIQWALLPLVLVGALFSRRIYCNFACPVGYVLTKITILRARIARLAKGERTAAAQKEAGAAPDAQPASAKDSTASQKTAKETASKKERRPLKAYDVLVLVLGLAIAVVSLISIISTAGVFGG